LSTGLNNSRVTTSATSDRDICAVAGHRELAVRFNRNECRSTVPAKNDVVVGFYGGGGGSAKAVADI
jgi:hypothetical protein